MKYPVIQEQTIDAESKDILSNGKSGRHGVF